MRTDHPSSVHIPQLRCLWQEAFGDTDLFLDIFFRTAFSYDRCLCILDEDTVAAVLYWFDCSMEQQKLAYIYAVVTRPSYRGQGLCRRLISDTHKLLKSRGYDSAALVPQKESLRKMYAGMGYEDFGGLDKFHCSAATRGIPLRAIGPTEFAALRAGMLPPQAVVQERENLAFLAEQMEFFTGDGFLMAAYGEKDTLFCMEFLGDPSQAPGILNTLGFQNGRFRMPGNQIPFAMYCPLSYASRKPSYFGFAFD